MRNTKGEAVTIVLIVLGLLGATQLVPNWRVSHLFQKGPGTKELAAAQVKLDQLKAESDAAVAKLKAAQEAALVAQREQIAYSQQMEQGALAALKRAPVSAEVTLATGFLDRSSQGLRAAIGDLPVSRQAEIMAIVEGALSSKQAEIDIAKAALAQRDKDLAVETTQRKVAEAQIPKLTQEVAAKASEIAATQKVVTTKTAEVVEYANQAANEKKENGSLGAFIARLWKGLGVMFVIALILGALWLWRKFHSVGIKTLGNIIGDIRSGVEPTQAFDTHVDASIQPAVKKACILAVAANAATVNTPQLP